MFSIISDAASIRAAAQQLNANLRAALPERIDCSVGGAGGSFATTVAYAPSLDLWYAAQQSDKTYWHGFGNGAPQAGKKVALASEINIPADGLNRAISGAFARDDAGRVWLLHRGKSVAAKPSSSLTTTAPPSPCKTATRKTAAPSSARWMTRKSPPISPASSLPSCTSRPWRKNEATITSR